MPGLETPRIFDRRFLRSGPAQAIALSVTLAVGSQAIPHQENNFVIKSNAGPDRARVEAETTPSVVSGQVKILDNS